jgi:hypothetical protein
MSFLGYGDIVPNSNINPAYVNPTSSTYSGGFSSNEIPGLPGLSGAKSGIDAAAGKVPGVCMSGGQRQIRKLKRKIKNISNIYKMRHSRRRSHSRRLKRKLKAMTCLRCVRRRRMHSSTRSSSARRQSRRQQRGGYSQYQNNMPSSPGYSLGGNLSATNSALANPPIYRAYDNAIDNYNHYTGVGFDSIGH